MTISNPKAIRGESCTVSSWQHDGTTDPRRPKGHAVVCTASCVRDDTVADKLGVVVFRRNHGSSITCCLSGNLQN